MFAADLWQISDVAEAIQQIGAAEPGAELPAEPGAELPVAAAPMAAMGGGEHEHHHEHDPIRANDPTAPFLYLQHDAIPNFVQYPTNVSLRSGRWDDAALWSAGRVPGAGDIVQIAAGTTIDYAIVSDLPLRALGVNPGGTLRFARNENTRLTVGTAIVFEGGTLEIGRDGASVSSRFQAEVVFANYSLDLMTDPKQFGIGLLAFGKISVSGALKSRTWVELAREAAAGQDFIELAEPVAGWQAGETLLLPDTRQIPPHMADIFDSITQSILPAEWEEAQIRTIVGNRVYFTAPLRFDHNGGRSAEGVLEVLPHAALLDRNVVFRSQAPEGTRGHVMIGGRADAFIRWARFQSLGRTSALAALDSTTLDESGNITHLGTNQIGRYSLHLHHLVGPENPTNKGYQFQIIGNTIDDGRKWGLALHGTSFGSVRDNVVYNLQGAGYVTEDGTEIENYFYRNFAARIVGTNDASMNDMMMQATGRSGSGFWLHRAGNTFRGNVVADASFAGMVIDGIFTRPEVVVPAFRGALVELPGQSVEITAPPVALVSDLEVYGRGRHGVWISFPTGAIRAGTDDSNVLLRRLVVWHTHGEAIFAYHLKGLTIDGALLLGDRANLGIVRWGASRRTVGMQFIGYEVNDLVIRNSRVENFHYGIIAPDSSIATLAAGVGATITVIEDSTLANFINLRVQTAKYNNAELPGKELHVNNTRFRRVNTTGMRNLPPEEIDIEMKYRDPDSYGGRDVMSRDVVIVRNFNRVAGDDFRLYYLEQRPDFVPPMVMDGVGSPVPSFSNEQLWSLLGVALAGAVAPAETTHPGILGYVGSVSTAVVVARAPIAATKQDRALAIDAALTANAATTARGWQRAVRIVKQVTS